MLDMFVRNSVSFAEACSFADHVSSEEILTTTTYRTKQHTTNGLGPRSLFFLGQVLPIVCNPAYIEKKLFNSFCAKIGVEETDMTRFFSLATRL